VLLNDSASWRSLKPGTLPRPVNALVESHPLKARYLGRALHTSCQSPRPMAVRSRCWVQCCVPVRKVTDRQGIGNHITVWRLYDHSWSTMVSCVSCMQQHSGISLFLCTLQIRYLSFYHLSHAMISLQSETQVSCHDNECLLPQSASILFA